MTTQTKRLPIRQGDVMFMPVAQLPAGERKQRLDGVVALGEATGHSHRLNVAATAEVLDIGDGLYVQVSDDGVRLGGAVFVHQEHGPAVLPSGAYRVTIQREYKMQSSSQVFD